MIWKKKKKIMMMNVNNKWGWKIKWWWIILSENDEYEWLMNYFENEYDE